VAKEPVFRSLGRGEVIGDTLVVGLAWGASSPGSVIEDEFLLCEGPEDKV